MIPQASPQSVTDNAVDALYKMRLPIYSGDNERSISVAALSCLLVKLREIDELLGNARAVLVVLQPSRNGRIDLRIGKHRSIVGARSYCFVQWRGNADKQYAKKLPTGSAANHIKRSRGAARAQYSSARRLARKITKVILERQAIIRKLLLLRRASATLRGTAAVVALKTTVSEMLPLAIKIVTKST